MWKSRQFVTSSINGAQSTRSSDDEFSELEIGPGGQRLHRSYRDQHFQSRSSQSNSVYAGYSRQYDAKSLGVLRSTSPMSLRSTRSIDPDDPLALVRSIREGLDRNILPLQELIKITREYTLPSRKRRRRDRSRGSEGDMDVTSEEERHSTRSEFPTHQFKRPKHAALRPHSRAESGYQFHKEIPRRCFNGSRVNKSNIYGIDERPCVQRTEFSRSLMRTGVERSVSNMNMQQQRAVGDLTMLQDSNLAAGTLASQLQELRQPISSQQPQPNRQLDLRNLSCTETAYDVFKSSKSLDIIEKDIRNDHVFLKPKSIPIAKNNNQTAPVPPLPKPNVTNNRLSDVSEIPELNQNSSNESMRPSFIKRKLFTQTLDVAQEKDEQNDDSLHLNSPVPNIYSSVPRPKNKTSKLISRPLLKKNILNASQSGNEIEIRHLIEQLVPQEKMNATTGNLQKKPVRSSIHEGLLTTKKNNIDSATELDYDSDIFGNPVCSQTLIQKENIAGKHSESKKDEIRNNNVKHQKNFDSNNIDSDTKLDDSDIFGNPVCSQTLIQKENIAGKHSESKKDEIRNNNVKHQKNFGSKPSQVHNNLQEPGRCIMSKTGVAANKKTINIEVRGNKRLATTPASKPTMVMKTHKDSNNGIKSVKAAPLGSTGNKSVSPKGCDSSEMSFRHDIVVKMKASGDKRRDFLDSRSFTPNNSSLTSSLRRSTRKVTRPSYYLNFSLGNTPKDRKRGKAAKSTSNLKNSSADSGSTGKQMKTSPTFTASEWDLTLSPQKTPVTRLQSKRRQTIQRSDNSRALSPTFTASDSEMAGSPRKTPAGRQLSVKKNAGSAGRTQVQPRKNANSAGRKKLASPTCKVLKQRISFGRKAGSPRTTRSLNLASARTNRKSENKKHVSSPNKLDSFLEDSSADEFTRESLQKSQSMSDRGGTTGMQRPRTSSPLKELNMSVTTRSKLRQSGRKKSNSPVYNVNRIKPSANNLPKISAQNRKNTMAKENNSKAMVDSSLQDSSEEDECQEIISKKIQEIPKQYSTMVAASKAPVSNQHISSAAARVVTEQPRNELKTSFLVNRDSKSSNMFKQPAAGFKAPPRSTIVNRTGSNQSMAKRNQPRDNVSLAGSASITSNQSRVNASRANKSTLPAKIRALLPSDWEDDFPEEDNRDIRSRVNKLSANGTRSSRKRNVTSPTRSVTSVRSEMCNDTAIRRGVIQSNGYGSHKRDLTSLQRPGPSTLTMGMVSSFFRPMDRTSNASRFNGNASVASAYSFRSACSFRNASKNTLLHF